MIDTSQIIAAIRNVAGNAASLALHEPRFAGREWDLVKDCIDTGWVSSAGSYVGAFEGSLAAACGVGYAIAVTNGTVALHLALLMAGVKPGDEVVIPTLTFAATANAVAHAGAIPHLADSCIETLGVDPTRLDAHLAATCVAGERGPVNRATGRRIAAIVPMHTFGHPVDMDAIAAIGASHRVPVVEDATESLGSTWKGRPMGSFGRLAVLSFNGNKIITTGGGGAILTNDAELARRTRHVATTAKRAHRWDFDHDEIGYNYRMPNINAALGCAQLEQLDGFLVAKRRLAEAYMAAFEGVRGVTVFREPMHARSNYWLNALLLDEPSMAVRDDVLAATNDAGLMTRPVWKLMHRLPMYSSAPRMDLSVAESMEGRIINIPSSAVLASAVLGLG